MGSWKNEHFGSVQILIYADIGTCLMSGLKSFTLTCLIKPFAKT